MHKHKVLLSTLFVALLIALECHATTPDSKKGNHNNGATPVDVEQMVFPRGTRLFRLSASMFNNRVVSGDDSRLIVPYINFNTDFSLLEKSWGSLGGGFILAYAKYSFPAVSRHENSLIVGPTFSYHRNLCSRTELYAELKGAVDIGLIFDKEGSWNNRRLNPFNYAISVGVNRMLSDRFGLFAQTGWGNTWLTIGIIYRPSRSYLGQFYGPTAK